MIARTQLAILDHNCGVSRKQILGEGKINTQYTKVTAHYVAKKVMDPKDKNYIKEIIDEVKSSEYSEKQTTSKATIAPIPNPGKESIKKSQITRFAKNVTL